MMYRYLHLPSICLYNHVKPDWWHVWIFTRWLIKDYISFMVWFCWLYIPTYLILLKCIMSDMLYFYHEIFYSFELQSCALLSYTFRRVCFVHIGIFRIGENYIQKVSCAMITKWKPSPILYWNASSTFFCNNWFFMSLIFPRYWKAYAFDRQWIAQWIHWITKSRCKCKQDSVGVRLILVVPQDSVGTSTGFCWCILSDKRSRY